MVIAGFQTDGEQLMERKSQKILKAIAAGHSHEQILASDSTLTRHDIFRAISEAPEGFWKKTAAGSTGRGTRRDTTSVPRPAKQRRD